MEFIWPAMLVFLVLIPLCVLVYFRWNRKRQAIASRFGNLGLLQGVARQQINSRRHLPLALFLLALTLLIVGMARPATVVNLPRVEGMVILAFDVSGSMVADDFKPTRMDAAKAAAQAFVERQPRNVQIGVVAFSESGIAVQVPTYDQSAVVAAINRLSPQRATSLANGILASLTVITAGDQTERLYTNLTPTPMMTPTPVPKGTYTSGVVVLLTDGENNVSPDPLVAAQAAADMGVRIFTVGVGTTGGTNVKVNGVTMHTRLDEETLQKIALLTDGVYYNADSEETLRNIYDNLNPQLIMKPEKTEVTAIFAGVSIFVLLIGGALSLLWFGRMP